MIDLSCEQLITLDDAAALMKLSRRAVRRKLASESNPGGLEWMKFGRTVRTSVEAVQRFATSSEQAIDEASRRRAAVEAAGTPRELSDETRRSLAAFGIHV